MSEACDCAECARGDDQWCCRTCHDLARQTSEPVACSCGNDFDGDNFCMPSACQWEK